MKMRLNERGFSLIELIFAMSIFVIGILAVTNMQFFSSRHNVNATLMTEGALLAESKLEELMTLNFEHADLVDTDADGNAGLGDRPAADHSQNPSTLNDSFMVYWNIADRDANSKIVRVIVTWRERLLPKNYFVESIKIR